MHAWLGEELIINSWLINLLFNSIIQELWYRADYDILRATMPYVSQYDSKFYFYNR